MWYLNTCILIILFVDLWHFINYTLLDNVKIIINFKMKLKTTIFTYFLSACLICLIWLIYSINYETIEVKIIPAVTSELFSNINKNKLFDISFKYLINNHVCDIANEITAVILVTSHYGNTESRSVMRRAFSNEELRRFHMRRVFLIAEPQGGYKSSSDKVLSKENEHFSDLIQGNFKEAYRNLTYKHVMGLQWAAEYCSNAKFIIKMDDDIVVDIYKLVEYLHKLSLSEKRPIAGYVLRGMNPIRERHNKWFVTKEEYSKSFYPPFVSGWFYITTPKVATLISKLAKTFPYFWIDDVFITGVLSKKLKFKHLDISQMFRVHPEYLECCMKDLKLYKYNCPVMVAPNGGNNNLFFIYNKIMSKCSSNECVNRPEHKQLNVTCIVEKKFTFGQGKALVQTIKL